MNLLLDTCTFLWIIKNDTNLSQNAASLFQDSENTIFLSSASAWEIAIKMSIGKLPLQEDPDVFIPKQRKNHGIKHLTITEEEVLYLNKLPAVHKDPFDRILICQSIVNGFPLITPDPIVRRYAVKTLW
jgi:PIN domain nuclease of toxin-antitoxin system